jgi:hypothetical protein
MNEEVLNYRLKLARYLTLSLFEKDMTIDIWKKMRDLEEVRLERIKIMIEKSKELKN